ncbi:hypothetical protein GCM10009647_084890 [Streptomyces sanglieri]
MGVKFVYECHGCREEIVWELDEEEQKQITNCSCGEDAGLTLYDINFEGDPKNLSDFFQIFQ